MNLTTEQADPKLNNSNSQKPDYTRQDERISIFHSPVTHYLAAVGLVVLATLFGFLIEFDISPTNLVMIFLLVVVLSAFYLGRGPAILASVLGVLAFDYFFVPPVLTLNVHDTEYLITFVGLFTVGFLISALTARAREQAESARRREADTAVLYALSRDLAAAESLDSVIRMVEMHITPEFGQEALIYLPDGDSLHLYAGDLVQGLSSNEGSLELAQWAYQNNAAMGYGTANRPSEEAVYLPLITSQRTVGVLAVKPAPVPGRMQPEQNRMLQAFASLAAQAIERVNLVETTRQIELLQSAEKLQNALLNSISHDLRTPLVSITGVLTTLEQNQEALDPATRFSLVVAAREEADRLNRLVGNLLDMTRLEAGVMRLKREPTDVQDLVGVAMGQMENQLEGRNIRLDIPDWLPLVQLDFVLVVHTLNNLIDNALKYSPEGSPLEIQAEYTGNEIQIRVLDRGIGIPQSDLERVFDKFYRVQRSDKASGTGLGLAICKGIIEAHGGRIWAANRSGGGAIITLALPVDAVKMQV